MSHKNIKYIILLAFVTIIVGYGQDQKDTVSILHRDLNKIVKIDFHKVFQFDSQNLLDKDFVTIDDSVEVYNFNNEFWFKWKLANREWDEDRSVELFSFCLNTNKIFQITNHNLYWSNGYSGMIEEVYYFEGRMFVIGKSKNEDLEGHNVVLVIDPVAHSLAKEIHLINQATLVNYQLKTKCYL